MRLLLLFEVLLVAGAAAAQARGARGLLQATPESVGLIASDLARIDTVVEASIKEREIPGGVVLVARKGRVAYLKAFGQRAVAPSAEPMTVDTIFDMASLTKVVATSSSVMVLVDRGLLRLDDRVRRYLPKFTGGGKESITVHQLLTHFSGLRPDFDLSKKWFGTEAALEELWAETTVAEPGREFIYSDLNFITLGEIVRSLAGEPLDAFSREAVFEPLGMTETRFNPPAEWIPRIAPTESRARSLAYLKGEGSDQPRVLLRGEVHDPTAWRMDGVAGHAGLFSTARDLSIYAQMLLNGGSYQGNRVLSPLAVVAMTTPQSPRGIFTYRGLGWDIETGYSSPRGDLLGSGFGHTGFTGTSLWIQPANELFIIILTNRVHPDGQGDATHLRGVVANIVAAAIADPK